MANIFIYIFYLNNIMQNIDYLIVKYAYLK